MKYKLGHLKCRTVQIWVCGISSPRSSVFRLRFI